MGYNSKYTGREVEELLDKIKNFKGNNNSNVDLSQYVTLSKLTEELQKKVDAVIGKGLSTEDFTTTLKEKLNSLNNYDDTELSNALTTLREDFDKLVSGDTTTAIKTFNEVIAFLDGLSDTEDLSGIIASIERQIAGKQDSISDLDTIREEANKVPTILGEDGYVYSNGEKVDMRFTRSLIPVGTAIPANANLNTIAYLKIGKYYCTMNVDAKTVTNCPSSVAFSMEVFNPLGTNVDDESTREYTYRLRVLTQYDTGQQYIQFCKTNGTAGSWTYGSWYISTRAAFTLKSSKNGGSAALGGTTRGVYIDSTGTLKQMSYTIAKSVPSSAVFTDTKVTAVANHYTPVEDTAQTLNAPDGEAIIGLNRDAAGHIVGVETAPIGGGSSMNIVNFEVNQLDGNVGDYLFSIDRQEVDEEITEFFEGLRNFHNTISYLWFDNDPRGYAKITSAWYDTLATFTTYRFGYIYNGYVYEIEVEDGPGIDFKIINKMKIAGAGSIEAVADDTGLIVFSSSSANGKMRSNINYVSTVAVTGIQIESGITPTDLSAEYTIDFCTGDTIGTSTFPSEWLWVNGVAPTLEASTSYELSVKAIKVGDNYIYKAVLTSFKQG